MTAQAYIERVRQWAQSDDRVLALALVGSHACHAARPDSDIDFVIICRDQPGMARDTSWVRRFGEPVSCAEEDWGTVTSIRATYADGQEIEFGLAAASWAALPVDEGTRRVVSDGIVILSDPSGILERLIAEC